MEALIVGKLKGAVAIVTGGSRGIGFSIAKKLAMEEASVLIADILDQESEIASQTLRNMGADSERFIVDVSKVDQIYQMTAYCEERFGRIDILVNNAGVQKPSPSMLMSEEDFDRIMDVNLKGAFFCSQAVGHIMRKNGGGKIVSISSGNSRMTSVGRAPYCISKTGINAMTAVLGAEWAMYNIRVNAIAPGWIRTEMAEYGLVRKNLSEEQILSVSPIGRWGTEEEIANLTCYLVSDEASYIVGQTIFCDGGWSTGILPNALDYIRREDPEVAP
jgi:NAD(P)-dependent dehydrogenase (short-subunit alcohol dehydrogenase family)